MGYQFLLPMVLRWRASRAEAPLIWGSKSVSAFLFFCRSLWSYKQLKEQEGYFLEPRSLTGRKKQTRQDIKIRRHGFWDKGVKKSAQCLSLPPDHFWLHGNWILQAMYFNKTIAIFSRQLSFFFQLVLFGNLQLLSFHEILVRQCFYLNQGLNKIRARDLRDTGAHKIKGNRHFLFWWCEVIPFNTAQNLFQSETRSHAVVITIRNIKRQPWPWSTRDSWAIESNAISRRIKFVFSWTVF